jgi:hypothetical protein
MSREEKEAWFTIVTFGVTAMIYLLLTLIIGPKAACAAFGLLGVLGLSPMLFRGKPGQVTADERDILISRKASVAAGMSSYLVFVLGCMSFWYWYFYHDRTMIDISVLPCLVLAGAFILYLVRSIVVIVLYRKEASYGES